MAKYLQRIEARKLRSKGMSVNKIANRIHVTKGTVSLWVRDMILTVKQLEQLRKASLYGLEKAAFKGALIQKQRRMNLIRQCEREGSEIIGDISEREKLLIGLGLYWAEGTKKKRDVSFCNSDPNLINFMIEWLNICFGVERNEMKAIVGINEIHRSREDKVKKYWSKSTGLSLSQFRKTSFKKSKVHKVYDNYETHYGTLTVVVLKPARFYYRIMGLIGGLSRQGSSMAERVHHKDTVVGSTPTLAT